MLIDFYADWCVACKELDRKTFADKRVTDKSKEFTMVRVNCTSPANKSSALISEFKVSGLPTVVFISARGDELRSLRATGFQGPSEMLRKMQEAMAE
jgi:thiol:disulfide interchange protein DsbD